MVQEQPATDPHTNTRSDAGRRPRIHMIQDLPRLASAVGVDRYLHDKIDDPLVVFSLGVEDGRRVGRAGCFDCRRLIG